MATKRKSISKKTRFEIFKRDLFTCQYCGAHPPKVILHIDHIIPVKSGGQNNQDNLITSCSECNLGKSANSLTSIPKSLSEKAKEIAEREAQIIGYTEIITAARDRLDSDTWVVCNEFLDGIKEPLNSINRKQFLSIKNFVDKLGVGDCLDGVEIALARNLRSNDKTFRYLCGVLWNKVRDLGGE